MPKVKLGDVATEYKSTIKNSDGYPVVGLEHLTPGDINLTLWDENVENSFTKGFKKGQVLFGRRRAYLKKAAVAPFDGVCSGDIIVIAAKENKIIPELLPFIIQNDLLFDYAMSKSAGGMSPRVKWRDLKEYEFELPEPAKQKRILQVLKSADSLKKAYSELIKATDDLVLTHFVEMLNNSDQKNTLGSYIKRCTPNRCGGRELPVLSVTKEKAIILQEDRFESTVVSRDKSNYIIVPRGYIVQGIHIDEGNFGLQNVVDEGIVSPAYKLWKIINNDIIPELLEYLLRSEMAIEYYKRHFLGTTVKRRQVMRPEDLLAMPTNFPTLPKQKDFWEFKLQCDKSNDDLRKAIDSVDAFINSVVQNGIEHEYTLN